MKSLLDGLLDGSYTEFDFKDQNWPDFSNTNKLYYMFVTFSCENDSINYKPSICDGHLSSLINSYVCSCRFFNFIVLSPYTYAIIVPSSFTAFRPNLLIFLCWAIIGRRVKDFWLIIFRSFKFHFIMFPSLHAAYIKWI